MSKIKYSNKIYGFDIETTTYNHIVTHYLSNFQSVNFSENLHNNVNKIIKSISKPHFCRTNDDVNKYLVDLNLNAENEDVYIIVYVHNLAYEFSYLVNNIDFVRDNYDNDNALFVKPRIPLFFRVKNIEFRCSYKLLNKSLRALGDNLGYPKLDIDYKSNYFWFSDLPKLEYEYNERDVKLMLLAVIKGCSSWKWIQNVNDIPLTSTGFTRKNNKKINTRENIKLWSSMCNYQRFYTSDYIDFIESVYTGAYTHSNAFYTGVPLENVGSFDIVSSYIDTILHRYFPHYFVEYNGRYKLEYLKRLIRFNEGSYIDKIKNYQTPFNKSFMAFIKIVNVKAKILKNNNLILPISFSKCVDFSGVKLDNGRVYKADMLTINLSEVDYYIFTQFYDFDLVDCFRLVTTKTHKPLPPFVTEATRAYLDEKSTLKKIIYNFEHGMDIVPDMFYNEQKQGFIYDDDTINAICSLEPEAQEQTLNDNYRASKNKLNAQYGINVQKLRNPNIDYDLVNDECVTTITDTITDKVLFRDFVKGLYITAYSRLNLFCYALYVINRTNTKLIYSDTDSWKMYGDIDNVIKVTKQYNNFVERYVHNSKDYNIGYFDFEGVYSHFCTLGCKKYVVENDNKIKITIAGVSKKTSQPLTELYSSIDYDFDLFCDIAFSPCTIYDFSITGKLCTKYKNDLYNTNVIDENGKNGNINGRNMVELVPSDYILMNILKRSTKQYIDHFTKLQNNYIKFFPTVIYRNASGKVTYKILENWKNELKIYKEKINELELSVDS